MKRRQFTALAAAMPFTGLTAFAQDRTTRILVGFAPGGSTDLTARVLAENLRTLLGHNVVVENKPGASGRLALAEVKKAAPDGQTLAFTPNGSLVIQPHLYTQAQLGYDPVKDFTPISLVSVFDFVVTVGPAAPGNDLRAVLAWMRANPSLANYATPGAGSLPHFLGQMLGMATGVQLTAIPYRGDAPATADLIGGRIPMMLATASETIDHHKAGRARILAVTGEQRNAALPDVPTLKELGIDMSAESFFGLYGPAGMPQDIASHIDRAVAKALDSQSVRERIHGFGLIPRHAAGPQLAALQARHLKMWEAPVKASGFKPQ